MTLGQSAGRSRGNPTRVAARRRFSEAERDAVTHPKDDPQQWPDEVNTVMVVSGRILGFVCGIAMAAFGMALIDVYESMVVEISGAFAILLGGEWVQRAVRWETTRRL